MIDFLLILLVSGILALVGWWSSKRVTSDLSRMAIYLAMGVIVGLVVRNLL